MATDWKQVGKYASISISIAIAFFGALFGGMTLAYGWGKDVGQGEIAKARDDIARANQDVSTARAELTNLKVQLASARPMSGAGAGNSTGSSVEQGGANGNPFIPKASDANEVRVTVQEGSSVELFNGELMASVVAIEYDVKYQRDRVDMTVSFGSLTKKMIAGEVGDQLKIGKFKITIVALNSIQANIKVEKIKE